MAQAQKPTKRTDKTAKIEQVELPEPAGTAPEVPANLSSDEDVTLAAKTIDSIIADLKSAEAAERGLEFSDDKSRGHRDANIKALQDCVKKLETANKRHGWMHDAIEKARKAIEREEAAAKRAADKARKAAEKAQALEAAKALAAQEGK